MDEPVPWVLQLVARVERIDPPTRTDVLTAAARAVAALLDDARACPGGAWHDDIETWTSRRIRKHCRRARGTSWARAVALDGVTEAHGTAQVRAFPPTPVDAVPAELARLQLEGGAELDDPDVRTDVPDPAGDLVIAIATDPVLPWGKAAAAAGHAAQLARLVMPGAGAWREAGHPVRVVQPAPALWRRVRPTAPVVVRDGGFTVVEPGTITAVAWL